MDVFWQFIWGCNIWLTFEGWRCYETCCQSLFKPQRYAVKTSGVERREPTPLYYCLPTFHLLSLTFLSSLVHLHKWLQTARSTFSSVPLLTCFPSQSGSVHTGSIVHSERLCPFTRQWVKLLWRQRVWPWLQTDCIYERHKLKILKCTVCFNATKRTRTH